MHRATVVPQLRIDRNRPHVRLTQSLFPLVFDPAPSQLRWMLTMTPATRSPLHAHRIMCLCALPKAPHRLNPMRMPLDLNNNNRGETEERLVVAGDSGGGVAIFVIRGGGPGDCSDNGLSSFPAGRWMTASGRPVLCVTNVRVVPQPVDYRSRVKGPGRAPTSAKVSDVHGCSRTRYSLNPMVHDGGGGGELPSGQDQAVSHGQEEQNVHEQNLREDNSTASMGRGHGDSTKAPASRAVDLVVTGDTSGVVTVWRLAYDEASISSRHAAGKYNTRGEVRGNANSCGGNGQAPSDFVHRGSEGRRRGSVGILKNGKGAPQPDLVYVMEYRAHQVIFWKRRGGRGVVSTDSACSCLTASCRFKLVCEHVEQRISSGVVDLPS